ncbi:MAG: carbamoyltransferase C-terminal domain-containing protein [Candidatus Omnitrophota bacterium]|jgi:carbamoyltransferase
MIILGITDNHDSGAVIFKNGKICFAVNEERLNREKITRRFPERSIFSGLKSLGISPKEVNLIIIGTRITPPFLIRLLNQWYAKTRARVSVFSYSVNLFYLWNALLGFIPILERIDTALSYILYKEKFKNMGFKCAIKFVDHHYAHAAAAFYTSGFHDALVVTMDGMGDSRAVTISGGKGSRLRYAVYNESGLSAVTTFYSRITEYLGFYPLLHEGKIMALAAYGNPDSAYGLLRRLLRFRRGGFNKTAFFLKQGMNSGVYRKLRYFSREDIAASAQRVLEEEVCKFVKYWIKKGKSSKLALAGGIFANIKLNQKLADLNEVEEIYIFPHMGDGGLAYGAVLSYFKPFPRRMENLFLGPAFRENELLDALRGSRHLNYEKVDNIEAETARLLADHKIVAHFSGRMEYGPRALGNRSIFYEAVDSAIKERLNKKLGRTEFMPFAPVLQYNDRDKYFLNTRKAAYTAEFLNISFSCKEEAKKVYPGIVHVDNTARPQFVREENNARLYNILKYYKINTGYDMLINTSFNMHEEPIVCTPQDAVSAFCRAGLDYLVLENFVISRRQG